MTKISIARALALMLAGIVLTGAAGCQNRGKFGPEACEKPAPAEGTAVAAIYYDINGQMVGSGGEDLFGTKNNQLCPAPPGDGTGGCATGKCPVAAPGRTICVVCPKP